MDTTYYYCKCSICFENDSEMEFINCGDQYCLSCLERYVEYWIKEGSWGLLPTELTCPVCGSEMLDDDWMPYVSGKLMALWNNFQIKRKETIKNLEIHRQCPLCDHLQPIMGTTETDEDEEDFMERFGLIGEALMNYLDSSPIEATWRTIFGLENVLNLFQEYSNDADADDLEDLIETCQDLFNEFLNLIDKLKVFGYFNPNQKDLIYLIMKFGRRFLSAISKLLPIEDYESNLIDMQLNFQSTFPFGQCENCELEFCLPCQEGDWFHCRENKVDWTNILRPDGSKQCPRCFIAIEKEPDGCNEMRCNYCGMKFCWECGRKWSKDCGIYKCKKNNFNESDDDEEVKFKLIKTEPEVGVPNMQTIHNNK